MKIEIGTDVWCVSTQYRPALIRGFVKSIISEETEKGVSKRFCVMQDGTIGPLKEVYENEIFPVATHCHDALCALSNLSDKVFFE